MSDTPENAAPSEQPIDTAPPHRRTSVPGNLVRGALIGAVETVPGVSGGTVALVVGIYHQIIDSASAVISAFRRLVTGPDRKAGFTAELSRVHWKVVLPVAIGMLLAVFTVAGPMADAMENYPVTMRGLFFGMVLASVAVPARMMLEDLSFRRVQHQILGKDSTHIRLRPWHVALGVVAAVGIFFLVSLPPTDVEPSPLVLIPAAAVAISALVLPGLSGSFLLLTFGLYEPTLRAVDNRDFGYLGIFVVGAILGMIVVVKVLKWLLEQYHTLTLAVLTGVMIGGLRTLWPWQDEARTLAAPGSSGEAWTVVGLAAAGFAVVITLVIIDARMVRRQRAEQLAQLRRTRRGPSVS